jgi:pimeloyl-ACP methyl ester carboxylesterase
MQERRVGDVAVRFVEHGTGPAVVVLHGGGVDHREAEACFEPALAATRHRRIYPDLPGMGETVAPERVRSADDVVDVLLAFVEVVAGDEPVLLAGHSAGAYLAAASTTRRPDRVAGLALVCPLLPGTHDVPPHRPVIADATLGDAGFRDYFVIQTPAMLDRYRRFVEPAIGLADPDAAARIGERWEVTDPGGPPFDGQMLVVAGRQDATVGSAASVELAARHPHATLAVLDGAGHALPHERPEALAVLLRGWLQRTEE